MDEKSEEVSLKATSVPDRALHAPKGPPMVDLKSEWVRSQGWACVEKRQLEEQAHKHHPEVQSTAEREVGVMEMVAEAPHPMARMAMPGELEDSTAAAYGLVRALEASFEYEKRQAQRTECNGDS